VSKKGGSSLNFFLHKENAKSPNVAGRTEWMWIKTEDKKGPRREISRSDEDDGAILDTVSKDWTGKRERPTGQDVRVSLDPPQRTNEAGIDKRRGQRKKT